MNACLTTHALPEHPDGVALSVAVYPKFPDHVRNIEQAKEYLDRVFSSMQDCAGWEFEAQIGSEADQ